MQIYVLRYTNGDTVISTEDFLKVWNSEYRQKGHALVSATLINHPSQFSKL